MFDYLLLFTDPLILHKKEKEKENKYWLRKFDSL